MVTMYLTKRRQINEQTNWSYFRE